MEEIEITAKKSSHLNVALCWRVGREKRRNHVIFIDPHYQYFVPFRRIESQELLNSSFYLAIFDRDHRIERIKCQISFIVFHLNRNYYRFELLRQNDRDQSKIENFNDLLSFQVNPSLRNGSLLLSPLPRFAPQHEDDRENE